MASRGLSARAMLFIVLAFFASGAFAAAGTVVHLSGSLSVQRPDGTSTILARNSPVNPGDVLTTQQDSYAQINFTDGSSITLRPNTIVRVDAYNFVQEQPQQDNSLLRLIKGGMRTVTGLIGRRGDQDAYKIGTQQATIGIRGSSGDTLQCADGCLGVTPTSDKLPPGLYHATHTGIYILQNEGGSLLVNPGQTGYVKDVQTPPTLLSKDPGLGLGELPFALPGAPQGECIVR